jgi:cytochrome c oxidase assembly factor CtaG
LAAVAAAYAIGVSRRGARRAQVMMFAGGLVVTAVAVASPLDRAAATSLTAHMVQHVLLLSVAAPLLALGAPIPTLLWALPPRHRHRALALRRRAVRSHDQRFATWVVATLVLQTAALFAWHLPPAYEAAVRHPILHAVEHATFLLTATAAWWVIATGRRSRRGGAAIAALIASTPATLLGTAMVLAPNPWYPIYAVGTRADALADQQVAGVVMWSLGGTAAVVAGAALFASWLASGAGPVEVAP